MIGDLIKNTFKATLPYVVIFSLGAVAGSGALSKQKNIHDNYKPKQVIFDKKTEKSILEKITDDYRSDYKKFVGLLK